MTTVQPPRLEKFLRAFRIDDRAWWELPPDIQFDLFSQAVDDIDVLTGKVRPIRTAPLPALMAVAIGTPAPQGSMRSVPVGGKAGSTHQVMTSMSKQLKPWRRAVAASVRHSMNLPSDCGQWPLQGPVAMDLTFTMKRPKYLPPDRHGYPSVRPDVDKLARAVLDATMTAGAIADDGQVVRLAARKVFPGTSSSALDLPGVRIALFSVIEESAHG